MKLQSVTASLQFRRQAIVRGVFSRFFVMYMQLAQAYTPRASAISNYSYVVYNYNSLTALTS